MASFRSRKSRTRPASAGAAASRASTSARSSGVSSPSTIGVQLGFADAALGRHFTLRSAGMSALVAALVTHERAQPAAPARQPRHHRAHGDRQHLGGLGVAQALEADQQDDLALLAGEQLQRPVEIAAAGPVGRRRRLIHTHAVEAHVRRPARLAPQAVDMQVVQDGEQPLARVVALAPLLEPSQRPLQRVLDQIVGLAVVARERPRVAAQPRDLGSHGIAARGHAHSFSRRTQTK